MKKVLLVSILIGLVAIGSVFAYGRMGRQAEARPFDAEARAAIMSRTMARDGDCDGTGICVDPDAAAERLAIREERQAARACEYFGEGADVQMKRMRGRQFGK
jgi:hypothetical protein